MKTQVQVLARDSLKSKLTANSRMFEVLYHFILFVAMPVAFEMSFVKIFQKYMNAYRVNDAEATTRLIIYFLVQWFLGVLVRKEYLKASLKRLTLAAMILVQVKEIFIEEVMFDMILSIIMESGLTVLLFFKFAHWVVLFNMIAAGLLVLVTGLLAAVYRSMPAITGHVSDLFSARNANTSVYGIHRCMELYRWKRRPVC